MRGLEQPAAVEAKPGVAGPAAIIAGEPVMWGELETPLAEAAGGVVLREIALDRMLEAECRARGIRVSQSQIDAERESLLEVIERDAAAGPANTGALLESVRRSRGLGDARFKKTLERNARLRALVRDGVEVTPDDVEQALQIRYGVRYRVRAFVASTQRDAIDQRESLLRDGVPLDVAFPRAASLRSVDASAVRGGLLEPISPADQTYPESIRKLLPELKPNELSPVVAADQKFVILLLDSVVEATERPMNAADTARAEVRRRRERVAMEDLARRLLAQAEVTPLEPALGWSWKALSPSR